MIAKQTAYAVAFAFSIASSAYFLPSSYARRFGLWNLSGTFESMVSTSVFSSIRLRYVLAIASATTDCVNTSFILFSRMYKEWINNDRTTLSNTVLELLITHIRNRKHKVDLTIDRIRIPDLFIIKLNINHCRTATYLRSIRRCLDTKTTQVNLRRSEDLSGQ